MTTMPTKYIYSREIKRILVQYKHEIFSRMGNATVHDECIISAANHSLRFLILNKRPLPSHAFSAGHTLQFLNVHVGCNSALQESSILLAG